MSETGAPVTTQTPVLPPVDTPLPTAEQRPEPSDVIPTVEPLTPMEETPVLPEEPDEETVLAAYRRAAEAWRWFHGGDIPFYGDASRRVGEDTYYRVDYPGSTGMDSLRGYLKGLFSDELVDGLLELAEGRYLELDGALYVRPVNKGGEAPGGGETRQVIRDGSGRLLVRVIVEAPVPEGDPGEAEHITRDFPYETVGDNWIFTDFSLIR